MTPVPGYKLIVQYDGTRYAGWQVQPGLPTIQGELMSRLRRICDEPELRVAGAARTDAGTHSLGQVATFTTSRDWRPEPLLRALNRLLPADIAISRAETVPAGFHARRSATGRVYRYQIWCSETFSPFVARYAYHYRSHLDLEAMREGAEHLTGEHDFSSFRASADLSATPVKTMRRIEIEERDRMVIVTVEGSSFLQHMVRTMAGTLLEIARGRWQASRAATILQARDRGAAGPTLPARGLFLLEVLYGPEPSSSLPTPGNG